MKDIFQPRSDPARSIYNAFQEEAKKRKGQSVDEWITAERMVVWGMATTKAQQLGLRVPTLEDVMSAEQSASGHVDYGSKWAYGILHGVLPHLSGVVRITQAN